ncbi:hypothetical protein PHLGIDRAFT_14488 [Phlebiopsis gigantea 11061_1 CR5-6]|uniref:Uncharacterized protein n=1 Tax=Phlebiopsis gigantea (strain 11061_1 CR5-6) TaxID=745531 RepID=A0A0C3RVU9_PHLG1|nr:hypothetical protein PHLGIDRAFT_14488 [Phlebiopsis gigantea 11061_1 CR5-6]
MQFTSVSLVSAWAFFLLLTTLAPAFSPRCPFKILFLKGMLKWARQWIRPPALLIRHATSKFVKSALDIRRWNSIHTLCTNMRSRAADFITFPSIQQNQLCDEEPDVITSGQEDADILLATDAMMLDDGLLSTILDVLHQSRPHPTVVIDFLMRIIANRIPYRKRETYEPEELTITLDLSMLSRHTYVTIMETVAQVLQEKNSVLLKDDSPVWMKNAMLLLMSSSPYPLPDSAQLALAAGIEYHEVDSSAGRALGKLLYASGEDDWSLQTISRILLSLLSHERPLVEVDAVFELFHSLLGNVAAPGNGHLIDTVLYNCSPDLRRKSRSVLSALWPLLVHVVDAAESTEDYPFARPEVCFYFILTLARRLDKLEETVHIFRTWWGRSSNTHWAMSSFAALGPQCRVVINASGVLATFSQAFMHAGSPREQSTLLHRSAELCSKYTEGIHTSCVDLDIVRLCAAHIDLYDLYEQKCLRPSRLGVERRVDPRVQDAWALLWGTMHEAVQKYWDTNGWAEPQPHYPFPHANNVTQTTAEEAFADDCRLALQCLQRMPALDLAAANAESSRTDTDGADPYEGLYSVFPLELYLTLRLFCAGENTEGIWYIRQPPPGSELVASTPPSPVVEEVEGHAHDSHCECPVCEEFALQRECTNLWMTLSYYEHS